ncbi:hypothetical protein ABZT03_41060 [Streptomyces sp. NPDC005574]|uniref:hypothetical protein n=1 Tax=Streptomyces sp. NPDC005574 TaxID=3156891 RepID=UPI0033A5597D
MPQRRSPSQGSVNSANSDASSFHSVWITDNRKSKGKGKEVVATRSSRAVPGESAPQLPEEAEVGYYDQNSKNYYAVARNNPAVAEVSRWDKTVGWVAENRRKIAKALLDVTPTVIQGVASNLMKEGTWQTVVNGAGVAGQMALAVRDGWDEYKSHQIKPLNPERLTAIGFRIASAGANLGSVVSENSRAAGALGGLGTFAGAVGTTLDVMAAPHQGGPLYEIGRNPGVGYGMGDFPPGYQTPNTQSSNPSNPSNPSMHSQDATSPTYYYPPTPDLDHYHQRQSSPGPSSYHPGTGQQHGHGHGH